MIEGDGKGASETILFEDAAQGTGVRYICEFQVPESGNPVLNWLIRRQARKMIREMAQEDRAYLEAAHGHRNVPEHGKGQSIPSNKSVLRNAVAQDMPLITMHIERLRLNDENLDYRQFVVAVVENEIAGFGRIKPYSTCFELSSLGVLEPFRRRGIATAILKRLIQEFPSNQVWITTDIPFFFYRFGFKEASNVPEELKAKMKGICIRKKHPQSAIMLLERER